MIKISLAEQSSRILYYIPSQCSRQWFILLLNGISSIASGNKDVSRILLVQRGKENIKHKDVIRLCDWINVINLLCPHACLRSECALFLSNHVITTDRWFLTARASRYGCCMSIYSCRVASAVVTWRWRSTSTVKASKRHPEARNESGCLQAIPDQKRVTVSAWRWDLKLVLDCKGHCLSSDIFLSFSSMNL